MGSLVIELLKLSGLVKCFEEVNYRNILMTIRVVLRVLLGKILKLAFKLETVSYSKDVNKWLGSNSDTILYLIKKVFWIKKNKNYNIIF